ncbi:hypothetical protein RM51_17755 [Chryseobacterium taiwanense]|uniref:Uncharacterized protein n=1 Tax=Chryseobacterium taiwanense TaxID=363331 RepID=A0A0B4D3U6_9FLAO|nr:hypothetical protein RM51_17755 [Chryseobacterium taiwanense]
MTPLSFTVEASERVILIFDSHANWTGFAVSNKKNGYNTFDLQNHWSTYWVPNNQGNFNIFTPYGKWIGLVIK